MKFNKPILMVLLFGGLLIFSADSAPQPAPRGRTQAAAPASSTDAVRGNRAAPVAARGGARQTQVSARAGARQTQVAPVVSARAGRNAAPVQPVISARSATGSAAIVNKKIEVAGSNEMPGVVNEVCRTKWFSCMDALCILGNENGMRCSCSDARKTYDVILRDIEDLNDKIKAYGATALENVKLSDDQREYTNEQMSKVNTDMKIDANAPIEVGENRREVRRNRITDFQSQFSDFSTDFSSDSQEVSIGEDLSKLQGDALLKRATQLCQPAMSGCEKDMNMIQTMYRQNIVSDCKAFEIELKNRQKKAAENYQVVDAGVRDAASEKFAEDNKYNLGECVTEFRKCMLTDAACGADWGACATNTYDQTELTSSGFNNQPWNVGGITLSAMTKLNMENKKAMCVRVTDSCIRADGPNRDQVWNSFIANVASELRTKEITSEADNRQSCLIDISDCMTEFCKLDDKASNTSDRNACLGDRAIAYNQCGLSTPERMGITKCEQMVPGLWGYLEEQLKSLQINACNDALREVVRSENICGAKYQKCGGMSADAVISMMMSLDENGSYYGVNKDGSTDNTTKTADDINSMMLACRDKGDIDFNEQGNAFGTISDASAKATLDKIRPLIGGFILEVQSGTATACEEAIKASFSSICGSTTDCDAKFADNATLGTGSISAEAGGECAKLNEAGAQTETSVNATFNMSGLDKIIVSGVSANIKGSLEGAVNNVLDTILKTNDVAKCIKNMNNSNVVRPFASMVFESAKQKAISNLSANSGKCIYCKPGTYLDQTAKRCVALAFGSSADNYAGESDKIAIGGWFSTDPGAPDGITQCPKSPSGWKDSSDKNKDNNAGRASGCNDKETCCMITRKYTGPNGSAEQNERRMNYNYSTATKDYTRINWGVWSSNKSDLEASCVSGYILTWTGCCPTGKATGPDSNGYFNCTCSISNGGNHNDERGLTPC